MSPSVEYLAVNHPRFPHVQRAIFTRQVVADCMTHRCRDRHPDRERLDACCQYGADVDIGERDAILARRDELRGLLVEGARDAEWFTTDEEIDPDFPSGRTVRTRTWNGGCVFLAHDKRGCSIHRASIEHGWDFHGTKPHVCRLFPLTYGDATIMLSDDYEDYSCVLDPEAPSVYRVGRSTLAAIFGDDLVAALDVVEAEVLADRADLAQHRDTPQLRRLPLAQ